MNTREMKQLMGKPNTIKRALEISILKWTMLVDHWEDFMKVVPKQREFHPDYPSWKNCPLCYHFKPKVKHSCTDCPLVDPPAKYGCDKMTSPYQKCCVAIDKSNRKEFMSARKAMLRRLSRELNKYNACY